MLQGGFSWPCTQRSIKQKGELSSFFHWTWLETDFKISVTLKSQLWQLQKEFTGRGIKCIKIKHFIRCLCETLSIESGIWITWFRIIVVGFFFFFLVDSNNFIVQENVKFHSILFMKMKTEKFSWCSEVAHLIWPWWGLLECSGIFRVRSTWLVNTPFVGTGSHLVFSVTYYLPGSLGWTVPPSG